MHQNTLGVLAALAALITWGLGDFLIQRSMRKIDAQNKKNYKNGHLIVLFYITFFGAIFLTPFALPELINNGGQWRTSDWLILAATSIIIFFAAIFDFRALKIGKISTVEPVFALEIPITAIIAFVLIGERLSWPQIAAIGVVCSGLIMINVKKMNFEKPKLEKGALLALTATMGMGIVNFLLAISSRLTSPVFINWFINIFITMALIIFFGNKIKPALLMKIFNRERKLVSAVVFCDNIAWLAFAISMVYLPVALATGLSESYIALAAIMGLIFNKEKLKKHQFFGLTVTLLAVIYLAYISAE